MNVSLAAIRASLQEVLQGEPLRAIVYGAAVVVWLVTHIAIAAGYQGFGPTPVDFTAALAAATAAAAVLTELARRYVYSPLTVMSLLGVDTTVPAVGTDPLPPVVDPSGVLPGDAPAPPDAAPDAGQGPNTDPAMERPPADPAPATEAPPTNVIP